MSDQPSPPPAKPKPGSLRDRIAAFEKSSTSAPTPGPPPPRPKPAGFGSWKPKPPSPPSSPPATATGDSPATASSPSAPATLPKPSGMSATDAKESISKGGSLKERMAALQGRGGFGAPPPPVAPKPALERPKWKPPPVVHAPVDDDDDQGAGSSTTRPAVVPTGVSVTNMAGIAAAVERTISPPSVTKSPESVAAQDVVEGGDGVSGAVSGASGDVEGAEESEKVVDEEEEERQRRAAIAARMARLGGARVGMAPPLFGPKPPVRRPTLDEPPKETAKAPEPKVEEKSLAGSPPLEAASAVPLPPSDHASPTPSDHVRSPDLPPVRKSSDSVSILSAEPAESHAAPKPPTSMPVPSVPRRTGPPRRKAPKPSASTDIPEEKAEEKVPDIPTVEPVHTVEDQPIQPTTQDVAPQPEVALKETSPAVEDVSPPASVDPDQADLYLKATSTLLSGSQDEDAPEPEHAPATEDVITPGVPDEDSETKNIEVVSPPTPAAQHIPPVQTAPEDAQHDHSDHDELSAADPLPTAEPEEEVKEQTSAAVALVESEDDEEARRKRVAERLAKMGGVNPFALPPQRKSSVGSAASVSSPPLPPTSPPLPVLQPNILEEATVAPPGDKEGDSLPSSTSPEPPKPAEVALPPQSPPTEDKAADPPSDDDDQSVYDDEPQSNVNPSATSNENDGDTNPFAALLAKSPPAPPPLPPSRPPVRKFSYADEDESEYGSGHASPLPPSGLTGATPASPDRDTHANQERRRASDASSSLDASVSSIPGPTQPSSQHYVHQNPAQPPRRLVPQTPAESEEEQEQDSDEDADSQLASSHLFVPPPVPPSGLPYVPTRLRHQPPEDDGNGSESDAPLPVLHRRSKTAESLERERQKERQSNLGKEPLTSTWDDREDDEEDGESGSDHGGEALPIPPRSVPAPPPVPLGTRPASIASPPRNIPPRPVSKVPEVPGTSPPASSLHDAPTLSVEGGEILDEDEGDPIDPAFHSPSRRGSFSSLLPPSAPAEGPSSSHLSPTPTPPLPIPPTPVPTTYDNNPFGPVARSPPLPPARSPPQMTTPPAETEEEDAEQARRKTIAERMAKLGGIKFGAAPPLPGVRSPMARRQDSERSEHVAEKDAIATPTAEEGQAPPDAPEAPKELTEEEEERARKERIAAKLAGMGGMRIGMMPMGMGMGVRPKSHVLRDGDDDAAVGAGVPSSPPAVSPPVRAVPPTRSPPSRVPPPPTQPPPSHYDSDKASDDGVKVEVEESDIEEVKYEDAEDVEEGAVPEDEEEEEAPPPLPSRSSRPITIHRQGSVDKPLSPPLPPGRPPVPSGIFRRPSATATQPQSPPQAHRAPTSEYVMVEEPSSHTEDDRDEEEDAPPPPPPARPATHRLPPSSSRSTMTYPPPPLPDTQTQTPGGGDNSLTSQWELPSIPTSTLDFGAGGGDLSMSWTDAGESLPAAHQARLQQQQKARLSLGSDNASLNVGSPRVPQVPQSPPATSSSFQVPPAPPSAGLTSPSVAQSQRERRLSADDLMVVWGRVGVQLCEVATTLYEKSKKQLIGDGTYIGFVESVLQSVPNAACDPVANDWGYLIYHQNGSSVLKRASEIMPGDIVEISDGKLKGHKGLQTYHQNVGGGGDVLVGVVGEFEAKKTKIRVFHANQHVGQQTVESVSYRLEDLKSGSVKVYRVLEIEA